MKLRQFSARYATASALEFDTEANLARICILRTFNTISRNIAFDYEPSCANIGCTQAVSGV